MSVSPERPAEIGPRQALARHAVVEPLPAELVQDRRLAGPAHADLSSCLARRVQRPIDMAGRGLWKRFRTRIGKLLGQPSAARDG
jgi:hypothetical protein